MSWREPGAAPRPRSTHQHGFQTVLSESIKACQKYSNKSNGTARQHACTTPARTLPSAQGVRYRMLYVVLSGQATRGRDGAFRDIAIPAPGSGRQRQNLQLNFGKQACTQCVYSPRARRRGEVHSPSVRRRACRQGAARRLRRTHPGPPWPGRGDAVVFDDF